MRKSLKSWSKHMHESLKAKLEEGTSISTTEQNFEPSLYLQVIREVAELSYKQYEVICIASTIGSYQNEKLDEVVEWINEVDKFLKEFNLEKPDNTNSLWYHNMLSRIRKIRSFGPNFTFRGGTSSQDHVRSSSINMPTDQECYCEIRSLIKLHCAELVIAKYITSESPEEIAEVGNFLEEIKLQLEAKIPETNSDWYCEKLAETRMLIAKREPAFSLQSQDVRSSSMELLSLHEELRYEIRSLISLKCADLMAANHDQKDKFNKELQEGINEVNKFITTIHQELEGEFLEKNFDWYRGKIAETRKLIAKNYPAFPIQSQDVGTSPLNILAVESKAPADDVGYAEEQNLTSSLQHLQLQKGTSTSTKEQKFKPSLFLQVLRELWELDLKRREEICIADVIGTNQNEEFDEVMEWINEAEKFRAEITLQVLNKGNQMYSYWCKKTITSTRKIRAKRGPVGSSSSSINLAQLSLCQELYNELKLLVNIYYAPFTSLHLFDDVASQQLIKEVDQFMEMTKVQLEENIDPETNSDWYRNKIAETRTMIDRCEPAFSLQPQMAPLSLHEELRCEVRLLINLRCVYALTFQAISRDQITLYPQEKYIYMMELEEGISEMKKLIAEINLQVQEGNNSDWYRNKIAETRMLNAKSYSAFPHQSKDIVGTREKPQIFLSFRGSDTRNGFTRYLYEALIREGFNVFMDDEGLKMGDSISQILEDKIEKSKLSIIIFSQKFAESKWCLNEVVKILECKEKNNQLVWPVFYKVKISDVKHQENSYQVAMSKQEKEFGSKVVEKWRSSLSEVCRVKALEYNENDGPEAGLIKKITEAAKNIKDLL